MEPEHPSYFALDRAVLGALDAEITPHLASCDRCRAHVEQMQRRPAIPEWLHAKRKRARWWLLAPAFALIALLFVSLPRDREYVGEKGAPSMRIYVKRGEHVFAWSGEPVREGDALRIGVTPVSYVRVSVWANDRGRWSRLYEGAVDQAGENLLPASWQLDGSSEPEDLLIALSNAPLPDDPDPARIEGAVFQVSLPRETGDAN